MVSPRGIQSINFGVDCSLSLFVDGFGFRELFLLVRQQSVPSCSFVLPSCAIRMISVFSRPVFSFRFIYYSLLQFIKNEVVPRQVRRELLGFWWGWLIRLDNCHRFVGFFGVFDFCRIWP